MPNPWTGKGNPYTREEVIERLQDTLGPRAGVDGEEAYRPALSLERR